MILILSVWCKKCYIDAHVFLFLSYVFTCLAQHCDVRYDFYVKLMYGWPLAPVAYRRAHVFLVLSYIVTFLVQYCDVRYDFHIKTMYGWFLIPVACRRAHVLFVLSYVFTFLVHHCDVRYDFYIKLMYVDSSSQLLVGGLMSFFAIICLYVLSSLFWCPLRFPHKDDVRLILHSSCL